MSKKSLFRGCFNKEHGEHSQALLKSESQDLYHIHWSLEKIFLSKESVFSTFQILALLVNKLATDEKYFALHRDNSRIPIQMQLSEKQKPFSEYFAAFLKSRRKLKHFE